jgi:hypothetical protein
MNRTYYTSSGLVAIAATGLTPVLYFSVPAAADANLFKLVPSIEADAAVPTVPSNSDIFFSMNIVTGAVGGGAALTPQQLNGNALVSNLTVKSGSTALTSLVQSTEKRGWTIPFAAGAFRESDEENTSALEVPMLPSTNYAIYMRVPVGPGFGGNLFARVLAFWAE